jgi:hypothetical protein
MIWAEAVDIGRNMETTTRMHVLYKYNGVLEALLSSFLDLLRKLMQVHNFVNKQRLIQFNPFVLPWLLICISFMRSTY